MARATDKATLLIQSEENYKKLMKLIETIPPEKQKENFKFEDRDKNIRDVLVHLHEWHLMMMNWYEVGISGEKPDIPAKGYTWQTIPDLNRKICFLCAQPL